MQSACRKCPATPVIPLPCSFCPASRLSFSGTRNMAEFKGKGKAVAPGPEDGSVWYVEEDLKRPPSSVVGTTSTPFGFTTFEPARLHRHHSTTSHLAASAAPSDDVVADQGVSGRTQQTSIDAGQRNLTHNHAGTMLLPVLACTTHSRTLAQRMLGKTRSSSQGRRRAGRAGPAGVPTRVSLTLWRDTTQCSHVIYRLYWSEDLLRGLQRRLHQLDHEQPKEYVS